MAGDEAVRQVATLLGVMNFILPSQFVMSSDAWERSLCEERGGGNWNQNSGMRTRFGIREVCWEGFVSRNGILGSAMSDVTGDGLGGVDDLSESAS